MRNLFRKIRFRLGLFTIDEVMSAINTCGHAKDRLDFEWKLARRLREMKGLK